MISSWNSELRNLRFPSICNKSHEKSVTFWLEYNKVDFHAVFGRQYMGTFEKMVPHTRKSYVLIAEDDVLAVFSLGKKENHEDFRGLRTDVKRSMIMNIFEEICEMSA